MTQRLTRTQAMELAPVSTTARVLRRPQYDFTIRQRPFAITPFLLAPVLPGETMQYLMLQARTVTEPINSALLGMWLEYYVFYVKHRDLTDIATDLEDMVLHVDDPFTTVEASDDPTNYAAKGCVDWMHYCLKRVTEEYFRDEGEAWDTYKIGSYLPAAKVMRGRETWMQSICDTADIEAIDTSVDLDVQAGTPDYVTLEGSDISDLLRNYEYLRDMQLVNMSYEDWLMTYGVKSAPEVSHRPELLRYMREWNMPSNVVAADSSPRYAVMWSTMERADKPRKFKEPGFIFGVTVLRPKAYMGLQHGQAAGLLNDAYGWLPAMLANQKESRLKSVSHTDLLLPDFTEDYTIDLGDIYTYGDQFCNYTLADAPGALDLPQSTVNQKYPDGDDADSYFVTPATNNYASTDGTVRLSIKTRTRDVTP